ncbi:hypothetical protein ACHAWU_000008, partial [Discostella pseudostelligera]
QLKVGSTAFAADGIATVQHHGQRKRSRSLLLRDYDLIVADSGGGRFVHRRHHAQRIVLHAHNDGGSSDDDDDNSSSIPDPNDYDFSNNNNFNDENDEEEEDGLTALANKKLGISLSSYLPSLTSPDNLSSLQSEAKSLVNTAFDTRLSELSDLQSSLTQSAMEGNVRREETSRLNAIYENQKLMEKIDALTSTFLEKNQEEREGTMRAANADERMGRSGRGVTWGSWGSAYLAGSEGEVIVDGSSGGGGGGGGRGSSSGGSLLLGGVDATLRRRMSVSGGGGGDDDNGGDDYATSSSAGVEENRVLIVMDDKKDKGASSRIVTKLSNLLDAAFDSDITIDIYNPSSSSSVAMGGNNAQSVILFASALENDKSNLENILGRLLKRTVSSSSSSSFSTPPTHLLLISSHGTSRTNQSPYSLQNFALLGSGKLDKLSEMESALRNVVKGRVIGKQFPLDYTIVKFGDVLSEEEERKKCKESADAVIGTSIVIRPGDALDGAIGPNAAARVVLEALAYQSYARNATLCAEGYYDDVSSGDEQNAKIRRMWNDKFLCLSGPELLRMEVVAIRKDNDAIVVSSGASKVVDTDADLDTKFEQLSQYIQLWATKSYGESEGSKKSSSGLTTPVIVRPSSRSSVGTPNSLELDGVLSRNGVRILFQTTNTGDRYKSASEEREDEKMRSGGGGGGSGGTTKKSTTIIGKARKEGGIEILVEKSLDNTIRVRARRCNMDDKTIVKEMSEAVILKSLEKAVESWIGAG